MCLDRLEGEVSSQQYNTWLRPLKAVEEGSVLRIQAPNRFIHDWVNDRFLNRIQEIAGGRVVHPVNSVFGGVDYFPGRQEIDSISEELRHWQA